MPLICRAGRHDPDRPLPVLADGLYVCRGCRDMLLRDLMALPALYGDLAHALVVQGDPAAPKVSGGSADPNVKLRDSVAGHRWAIEHTLTGLAGMVRRERGLVLSAYRSDGVQCLCRYLIPHVDWLCAHHGALGTVDAVRSLVRRCYGLLDRVQVRRFPVGRHAGCSGQLVAVIPSAVGWPAAIECEECREVIPPSQWVEVTRYATP